MCIRMVWLTMDAEGEEIVVSLCDEVLVFLDGRIIYYYLFLRMHDVRWLPITLVCVVHNNVCCVCVLGLAMIYGELQRLRSDLSTAVGLFDDVVMLSVVR